MGLGLGLLLFFEAQWNVLEAHHALVSRYRWQTNKFSKMKVHWRTYGHCLFVLYLASVVFK